MEINRNTPVEKILKSQEVKDTISNMLNPIRQTISERDSMFTTTMQSGGGLDEGQIIDGEPILFKSAQEVKDKYSSLSVSLDNYESSTSNTSIEKEKSELTELKSCLEKDLEMRIAEIARLTKEYYDAIDKAKEEGIDSPAEIEELYWNPSHGLIPVQEKEKKYDEDTLAIVNNRLSALGIEVTGLASLTGLQGADGVSYVIDTSGNADDIYNSACNLRDEISIELDYLQEKLYELDYNLGTLEQWHEAGKISDETYNSLKEEYETMKSKVEYEREQRQHYYDDLLAATKNNFGTHDGILKDARDFGNDDVETARNVANELNRRASLLKPLSELATITYEDGTTRVVSPIYPGRLKGVDEVYSGNLSGIVGDSSKPSTIISDTTMKAAHEVAQSSNQVHTDPTGQIEIFSTSEYVLNTPDGRESQFNSTNYLISEFDTLQANEAVGNTLPYGDTIYDKNEGKYYSVAEYLATHPDFSLDSFI